MFKRLLPIALLLLASALPARAADAPAPATAAPTTAHEALESFSYGDAVVLGLVEGITEFLPVSSTGHLILASRALGLDDATPLTNADGSPRWLIPPDEDSPGVPLTLRAATDTYLVVIQVGAIAAVVLVFFPYMLRMLNGVLGRDRQGLMLLRNILLSVLPAVVIGLSLDDWIEEHLFSIQTVIAALVVGSGIMFATEHFRRKRLPDPQKPEGPELWDLSPSKCLIVGLLQCVAMWPGMSRSMMTIVGGYVVGLSPKRAAEFSFLVGLPTLAGASLLKGVKSGPAMIEVLGWGPILVGFLVATVSAALAVRWLVGYLQRHGLAVFAWYRLALAAAVGIFILGSG